jgi:hypothetical protein
MKAIKSLLIIVMLFIGTISFAQSHNTATGSNCKYAKNRCTNMEGCPQCAACNINDKKEKDAKAEEIKKRNEKIWADAKAKKDAEQKAYQDKIDKEAADKKRKEENGKIILTNQSNSDIKSGKQVNQNEEKQLEMKKYSIKINGEYKMNESNSISILYNEKPIYTTLEYSNIYRISEKALIFEGFTSSKNISCNKRESQNRAVLINEKGQQISIGGNTLVSSASEYNDVIKISVADGNCYPDNSSGASLLNSSLRGRMFYEYNLLDLSLISSHSGKVYAPCPCEK